MPQQGVIAVTGANGFVGSHVCQALLEAGYSVRAVVRGPVGSKAEHLTNLVGAAALTVCEGDLLTPGGYDAAFEGADAVVHTAAVVEVLDTANAEERIVRPAVEGTVNVAASAGKAGVKRVVHISSVATVQNAFGLPDGHVYTEADWNGWSTVATDAYGFAKTEAERRLWGALEAEPATWDAVTLCPGVILGPCFTKAHTKSSAVLLRECIYGNPMQSYFATFVDVRDVARSAVAALRLRPEPGAAQARFIVIGDEPPMLTTALAARAQSLMPQFRLAASAKYGPWALWLLARLTLVSPFQEAMATRKFSFSNARLKAELGVSPRPLDDTIRDTVESMVDGGFVKPKRA